MCWILPLVPMKIVKMATAEIIQRFVGTRTKTRLVMQSGYDVHIIIALATLVAYKPIKEFLAVVFKTPSWKLHVRFGEISRIGRFLIICPLL